MSPSREQRWSSGARASAGETAATGRPAPVGDGAAARYRVFLSYSHADTKWARWLMRRLEGYRVPARFYGRPAPIGEVGARIAPVFRDRDELPTTSDLGEAVRNALRESATLVVICSPASARSRWVWEEILAFKRLHGEHRVFAFIVAGEPTAEGRAEDCFSAALRAEVGADGQLSSTPAEVVAADARPHSDGPRTAFVRLVAGLLGVGFDELRQRELQRRNRRLTLIAAGSVAGMAVTLGLAALAFVARNDAQRRQEHGEELLAVMLNDMKTRLQQADKLDALDEVGMKMMAYFQSLNSRDLTDNTLAQQAKALTQLGQIRIAQARYAEAARAFSTAFDRSAALVTRHPQNADMLYDRAQAEYWIGFVYWKRGQLSDASQWLTRYRDSAVAIAALEGPTLRARREQSYGHHNLAVLELERGDLAAARTGFLAEFAAVEEMQQAEPGDRQLQFRLADISSWLGLVAERDGRYAEAAERFTAQSTRLEALLALDPAIAHWRSKLADSLVFEAEILEIFGQRPAAVQHFERAQKLTDTLVVQDPKNRQWLSQALGVRLQLTALALADGKGAAVGRLLGEARRQLQQLAAVESKDRSFAARLATAWRLEAELECAAGDSAAADAAARAVAMGQALIKEARADNRIVGEFAQSCVLAGRIAAERGDHERARQLWNRALELLAPRLAHSNDWRLLDPAARALALTGRRDESRAIVDRLHGLGYQPLDPWPEPESSVSSVNPAIKTRPPKP